MRKYILLAALCIMTVVGTIFLYQKAKINKISCQSQFGPCDHTVDSQINSYIGKSMFIAYTSLNEELSDNPKVAKFEVNFRSPVELNVIIFERKPEIAVNASGEEQYYLYSVDGFQLSQESTTQLPVVNLYDSSVTNSVQTKFVIEMASALNQTYNVKSISVREGGMEFDLSGSPTIIFPIQGDIDVLLGSLTFVLSQLNTQLRDFRMESVDFRFRNPIIRTI